MLQQAALWHAPTYGFQISGRKRQDEYKLETACCNRFWSAGKAFSGLGKEHPFFETAANTVQVVIEP